MAEHAEHRSMPRDRDDESGRYKKSYTSDMVLETIEDYGGSASTSEVSDSLGSSRRLALMRLRELESDERVTARKVGNTFLWSVVDE